MRGALSWRRRPGAGERGNGASRSVLVYRRRRRVSPDVYLMKVVKKAKKLRRGEASFIAVTKHRTGDSRLCIIALKIDQKSSKMFVSANS